MGTNTKKSIDKSKSWFFMVPGWFFMVPGEFLWILSWRSSLSLDNQNISFTWSSMQKHIYQEILELWKDPNLFLFQRFQKCSVVSALSGPKLHSASKFWANFALAAPLHHSQIVSHNQPFYKLHPLHYSLSPFAPLTAQGFWEGLVHSGAMRGKFGAPCVTRPCIQE